MVCELYLNTTVKIGSKKKVSDICGMNRHFEDYKTGYFSRLKIELR